MREVRGGRRGLFHGRWWDVRVTVRGGVVRGEGDVFGGIVTLVITLIKIALVKIVTIIVTLVIMNIIITPLVTPIISPIIIYICVFYGDIYICDNYKK